MSKTASNNVRRCHQDEPTYWFAILEIARSRDDFAQAAAAKKQLERLGVTVTYEQPQSRQGAAP